jgi:hypothetical protein
MWLEHMDDFLMKCVRFQLFTGRSGLGFLLSKSSVKMMNSHIILHWTRREKSSVTWLLLINNSDRISARLSFLLMCETSRLYRKRRSLCTECETGKAFLKNSRKMICGFRQLLSSVAFPRMRLLFRRYIAQSLERQQLGHVSSLVFWNQVQKELPADTRSVTLAVQPKLSHHYQLC